MKNAAREMTMRTKMNFPRSISAVVVTLLLQSALMHAKTKEKASCDFTTFSAPSGYTLNLVNGVSDDGTVVGQLVDNQTSEPVAFAYSASGVFTEYAAPKSSTTWLYGANASSMNAGSYQDSGYPGHIHGFTWQGKNMTVVNYPGAPNTWLFDINQGGTLVGSFSAGDSITKGFMMVNNKFTIIAYPDAQVTFADAISDNGVVAGTYASSLISYGFLWQNGTFTSINYPKAQWGTALVGVNNSGVVAGNYFAGIATNGFIYESGEFKDIVYSGAKYTAAGGINNNGLVSGQIVYANGNTLGFTAQCK
jgi:hypothetical protein